jgi:hypothetical protein
MYAVEVTSTQMMEAELFSKTLVTICLTTSCHTPERNIMNFHYHKNRKFHLAQITWNLLGYLQWVITELAAAAEGIQTRHIIYNIVLYSHVKWVPCRDSMAQTQILDGDGLQMGGG